MGKAVFLHGRRDARVSPFNLREGAPDEVLLDVGAVGICGSDMHYYKDGGIGSAVIKAPSSPGTSSAAPLRGQRGTRPRARRPRCGGPQQGVPQLPLVPRRALQPLPQCRVHRRAPLRRRDDPAHLGAALPGRAASRRVRRLTAVMLEPLGVAIHAVDLAKPKLLERVALLGAGPIGLLILQVLHAAGAGDVLVVDPLPHRQEAARKLGAAEVGASVEDIVQLDLRRGLHPRGRGHQLAGRVPRGGARRPHRRPRRAGRHSRRRHLHDARSRGAPQGAQDQVRAAHGRGLSPRHRAGRGGKGRRRVDGHPSHRPGGDPGRLQRPGRQRAWLHQGADLPQRAGTQPNSRNDNGRTP